MRIRKNLMTIIIIVLPNIILAGSNTSLIHGIGVELGFGHNSLFWSAPFNIKTPGGVAVDRNDIFITSTIRANYKLELFRIFSIQPFLGYNSYGGKSSDDKYVFDAVEMGFFAQYKYSTLALGVGLKRS